MGSLRTSHGDVGEVNGAVGELNGEIEDTPWGH